MQTTIDQLRTDEDRYQLKTYAKIPISIESGDGSHVYDADGIAYLDFYGGHAVVSTGHCHPQVVKAIQDQAAQLIFYSNVVYSGVRARAVRKLLELSGPAYAQAFLANSGSEANENAIKVSRAATGRREVISTSHSFHGRTYGSLSATGISKYSGYLNTPVPMHRILPAEQVAAAVSEATAAVLVEPIQSLGGVIEIPIPLLAQIQDACRKNGVHLIFDEVQTGVGRTGTFLFSQQEDVRKAGIAPDMITLAKGIASGFPASALLVTDAIAASVKVGDLGATFGGGPLACAAIEATLDVIRTEKLAENAARAGRYIKEQLQKLELIEEVRGRGLLLGLRLKIKAKELQEALLRKHILTGTSDDPHVLRLMPPLTISEKEVDVLLEALKNV